MSHLALPGFSRWIPRQKGSCPPKNTVWRTWHEPWRRANGTKSGCRNARISLAHPPRTGWNAAEFVSQLLRAQLLQRTWVLRGGNIDVLLLRRHDSQPRLTLLRRRRHPTAAIAAATMPAFPHSTPQPRFHFCSTSARLGFRCGHSLHQGAGLLVTYMPRRPRVGRW